jgi:uncharacterized protein YodC (DUF2158 family)
MDFAVGDVVRLKSGGPKMTVEEVSPGGVNCSWFEKERRTDRFNPAMLVRVEKRALGVVQGNTSWVRARRGF